MSLEYEAMADCLAIVCDIETAGLLNAADYLDLVTPAKNLVDPAKIAADIAKRTEERDEKLALDWNVGRCVAVGWWTEQRGINTRMCPSEADERTFIKEFWQAAKGRTIITFFGRGFDLPFLIQRSRYLGIAHPTLDLRPYEGGRGNIDLWLELTFGRKDTPCMRTTLTAFCRRFGIPVEDDIKSSEIPALVAASEWSKIADHCSSDIGLTVALARRLGYVRREALVEAVI